MHAALLLAILPLLSAQPDRFGLPACSAPGHELALRAHFILCHSADLRTPTWTAYELKPQHLASTTPRPKYFRHDYQLTGPSAFDSDYRNSGYSRGHLVPARDVAFSEEALHDSFLLSNVIPQDASLNSGKWRVLENKLRS